MGADPVIYPARQSQRIGLTPAYLLRQPVDQGCEADVRVLLARQRSSSSGVSPSPAGMPVGVW